MCNLYSAKSGTYFWEGLKSRTEVGMQLKKLKNGKGAGKEEVTGGMIRE